jgi:hypothetical protein
VQKAIDRAIYTLANKTDIFIAKRNTTGSTSAYSGTEPSYANPVQIYGLVNMSVISANEVGKEVEYKAVFTFTSKRMRELGYLDSNDKLLLTEKDHIVFKGHTYNIEKVTPERQFEDTFLAYTCYCSEVS